MCQGRETAAYGIVSHEVGQQGLKFGVRNLSLEPLMPKLVESRTLSPGTPNNPKLLNRVDCGMARCFARIFWSLPGFESWVVDVGYR